MRCATPPPDECQWRAQPSEDTDPGRRWSGRGLSAITVGAVARPTELPLGEAAGVQNDALAPAPVDANAAPYSTFGIPIRSVNKYLCVEQRAKPRLVEGELSCGGLDRLLPGASSREWSSGGRPLAKPAVATDASDGFRPCRTRRAGALPLPCSAAPASLRREQSCSKCRSAGIRYGRVVL